MQLNTCSYLTIAQYLNICCRNVDSDVEEVGLALKVMVLGYWERLRKNNAREIQVSARTRLVLVPPTWFRGRLSPTGWRYTHCYRRTSSLL